MIPLLKKKELFPSLVPPTQQLPIREGKGYHVLLLIISFNGVSAGFELTIS